MSETKVTTDTQKACTVCQRTECKYWRGAREGRLRCNSCYALERRRVRRSNGRKRRESASYDMWER